jgi:DNA-binding PadR family transcriptional regulator
MRHTAMVPKGFLRFYVLKLLSEKPMSGSEIIQEIDNISGGHWRPSPGSIYPLMSWLQDEGYIKEVPTEEAGMKRYAFTDQGKKFLDDNIERKEEIRKRFRFFGPPLFGPSLPMFLDFFWNKLDQKGAREMKEASHNLIKALWNLREHLQENYSEALVNEARTALEEAANKIEDINKRFES